MAKQFTKQEREQLAQMGERIEEARRMVSGRAVTMQEAYEAACALGKALAERVNTTDNGDGTYTHHVTFTNAKTAYILLNDQMLDEDEWAERVLNSMSNSAATSPFVVLDENVNS